MMKLKPLIGTAVLAASLMFTTAAGAVVTKYTEGNRTDIDGSIKVIPNGDGTNDTAGAPPGFILNSIGAGDEINLHGRIIQIQDRYTFTSSAAFSVDWIFDGYMIGGVIVDEDRSGFSGVPAGNVGDNTSHFRLTNLGTLDVVEETYTTDINSTTGDSPKVFAGKFAAGTYELFIDGLGPKDAYYDIEISAVPLPAGALLLLTGVAGLGIARRRQKAAAAA